MARSKNKVVVLFVEGDTENVFFKKLISHLNSKWTRRNGVKFVHKNVKGIGNLDKKSEGILVS